MDRRLCLAHSAINDAGHLFVVLVFLIFLVIPLIYDVLLAKWMFRYHMNDFGKLYYSSRFFTECHDMYAVSPATLMPVSEVEWRQLTYMNPPHFRLLLLPLSFWHPAVALAAWTAASFVSVALSVRIVVRDLGWPRPSLRRLDLGPFFCFA